MILHVEAMYVTVLYSREIVSLTKLWCGVLCQSDNNTYYDKPVPRMLKYLQYVNEPHLTKITSSSHLEALKCTWP